MGASNRVSSQQQKQIIAHLLGGGIPLLSIRFARAHYHRVELQQPFLFLLRTRLSRQLWELPAVIAGTNLVKHFSQAVEIGWCGAGALWLPISLGYYEVGGGI